MCVCVCVSGWILNGILLIHPQRITHWQTLLHKPIVNISELSEKVMRMCQPLSLVTNFQLNMSNSNRQLLTYSSVSTINSVSTFEIQTKDRKTIAQNLENGYFHCSSERKKENSLSLSIIFENIHKPWLAFRRSVCVFCFFFLVWYIRFFTFEFDL